MSIVESIKEIYSELPEGVSLVAVSKTKPNEMIIEAYNSGHKIFGENKVQDLSRKYEELPKDIQWHFIGHLQRNKVKFIAPFINLIHALDSERLLQTINNEAEKCNRKISCLIQLRIAKEETKFGMTLSEIESMLNSETFKNANNTVIAGVMGMATYTDDEEQIADEFAELQQVFNYLKEKFFRENPEFKEISAGMTDDFHIAVKYGSTLVRVGSRIFGERN